MLDRKVHARLHDECNPIPVPPKYLEPQIFQIICEAEDHFVALHNIIKLLEAEIEFLETALNETSELDLDRKTMGQLRLCSHRLAEQFNFLQAHTQSQSLGNNQTAEEAS